VEWEADLETSGATMYSQAKVGGLEKRQAASLGDARVTVPRSESPGWRWAGMVSGWATTHATEVPVGMMGGKQK
jgi:hypothetical protein